MRHQVLVVDDRLETLEDVISHLRDRFDVVTARSLQQARQHLSSSIDALLLDIRLRDADPSNREGLDFLAELGREFPFIPVVMFSGFADVGVAVDAMKAGAVDFLDKSAAAPADVARALSRAMNQAQLERTVHSLKKDLDRHAGSDIIGADPKILEVRRIIRLVAEDAESTVLIRGETGTGKELVARAIHEGGARAEGPFVAVSLVSLNRDTISSELFGHERGAFTGAAGRRIGFIEQASRGVLFLDEIGELPEHLQVQLLRFLDDHVVMRLGSSTPVRLDLQLVAATNAPLEEMVGSGRLRSDLYYRLKAFTIELPPLRERRGDVRLIAEHIFEKMKREGRTNVRGFSREATALLERYTWPGNVRELRNAVESAVLRAKLEASGTIESHFLPAEIRSGSGRAGGKTTDRSSIDEALARFELEQIRTALLQTGGARDRASSLLGYASRTTMWRRIRTHFRRFPHFRREFVDLTDRG